MERWQASWLADAELTIWNEGACALTDSSWCNLLSFRTGWNSLADNNGISSFDVLNVFFLDLVCASEKFAWFCRFLDPCHYFVFSEFTNALGATPLAINCPHSTFPSSKL